MEAAANALAAPIQSKLQRWAAAGEVAEYYELKNRCAYRALRVCAPLAAVHAPAMMQAPRCLRHTNLHG